MIGGAFTALVALPTLLTWLFALTASAQPIVVPYYATERGTYTNVGCLADPDPGVRALGGISGPQANLPRVDVGTCVGRCSRGGGGFVYAGLEFRFQCFCDNTINNGRQLIDPSNCNLPCQDNATENCGGNAALQLYYLYPEDNVSLQSSLSVSSISVASVSRASSRSSATSVQQASIRSAASSRSVASGVAASSRASAVSSRSVASAAASISRASVLSSRSVQSVIRSSLTSRDSSSRSSRSSSRASETRAQSASRSSASSARSASISRRTSITLAAASSRTSRSSASVIRKSSRSVATASVSSRRSAVTSSKSSAASSRSSARSSVSSSSSSRKSSLSSARSSRSSQTLVQSASRSSVASVRSSISSSRSSVASSKRSTASSVSVARAVRLRNYVYDRCYTFSPGASPLRLHPFNNANSLESCANKCYNHTFFGVVSGSQCYCGDALLSTSTEPGATCFGTNTYNCPSNNLELCGSDTGMPIYGFVSSIGTCPAVTSIYSTPGGTTQACQTITGRKSGYTTGIF